MNLTGALPGASMLTLTASVHFISFPRLTTAPSQK
jgi:hypothetical protein